MYLYILSIGTNHSAHITRGEFPLDPELCNRLREVVNYHVPISEGSHITFVIDSGEGHDIEPGDLHRILQNVQAVAAEVRRMPDVRAVEVCAPANAIDAVGSVLGAHKGSLRSLEIKFASCPTHGGCTPCATAAAHLVASMWDAPALEALHVDLLCSTDINDTAAAALADALKTRSTMGTVARPPGTYMRKVVLRAPHTRWSRFFFNGRIQC